MTPPVRPTRPEEEEGESELSKLIRRHGGNPDGAGVVSDTGESELGRLIRAHGGTPGEAPTVTMPPAVVRAPKLPSLVAATDATATRDPRQPYRPGMVERTAGATVDALAHMIQNPGQTLKSIITEPIQSGERLIAPTKAGEAQANRDLQRITEQRFGAKPSGWQVEGVTGKERAIAGLQTAANIGLGLGANPATRALTPRLGKIGAQTAVAAGSGAIAGAVYTPDDPATGALVGLLLAAPLPGGIHGGLQGARAARPRVGQLYEMLTRPTDLGPNADQILRNAVAQLDDADLRYAANDPHYGPIFRQALEARGYRVGGDPTLKGLLRYAVDDPAAVTIEMAGARAAGQNAALGASGLAEKPAAGVELPKGAAGQMNTVEAVRRAEELAGEAFEDQVREEMRRRAGRPEYQDNPELAQAAAMEEVARRIVAQQGGAAPPAAPAQATPGPDISGTTPLAQGGSFTRKSGDAGAVSYHYRQSDGRLVRVTTYADGTTDRAHAVTDKKGDTWWVNQAEYDAGNFFFEQFPSKELAERWAASDAADMGVAAANDAAGAVQPAQAGVVPIEQPPKRSRKRGEMVEEDGEQRFVSARNGDRRRPVARVSTPGLLDEYLALQQKIEDATRRAQYRDTESDIPGVTRTVATRRGKGPTEQAKALKNLSDYENMRREIEATLAARGIDDSRLFDELEARREQVIERQAMGDDFDLRKAREFEVRDENGNVLFAPSDVGQEFYQSLDLRPRGRSRRGDPDVLMAPERPGTPDGPERIVARAIKVGDDVFDGRTEWDAVERAVRAGYGKADVLNLAKGHGYLTSSGRFVEDGPEAVVLAMKAGQIRKGTRIWKALQEGTIPLEAWQSKPYREPGLIVGHRGPKGDSGAPLPGDPRDYGVAGRISPPEMEKGGRAFERLGRFTRTDRPIGSDPVLPKGWRRAISVVTDNDTPDIQVVERFSENGRWTHRGTDVPVAGLTEGYVITDPDAPGGWRFVSRAEAQDTYGPELDFGPEGRDMTTGEALFDPYEAPKPPLRERVKERAQWLGEGGRERALDATRKAFDTTFRVWRRMQDDSPKALAGDDMGRAFHAAAREAADTLNALWRHQMRWGGNSLTGLGEQKVAPEVIELLAMGEPAALADFYTRGARGRSAMRRALERLEKDQNVIRWFQVDGWGDSARRSPFMADVEAVFDAARREMAEGVFGVDETGRLLPDDDDLASEVNRERGSARRGAGDDVLMSPDRDLFGDYVPDDRPAQGSLLDEQAGTAASRNLAQTERAARGEIARLRDVVQRTTDPAERQRASARIAELERLVNRDKAISADELAARAAGERTELGAVIEQAKRDRDTVQGVLFAPASSSSKLGGIATKARLLLRKKAPGVVDDVTNLRSISIGLSKAIGVPLHQGRGNLGRMRALGAFWIKPEVIRVKRLRMVGTVAHENGHYLSKKLGIKALVRAEPDKATRKAAMAELVAMGKALYGSRKPNGGYGEEGVAEAMKFYVTDPAKLAREAPTYSTILGRLLDENPDIRQAFDWARDEFQRFDQAPDEAKVEAMIARKPVRRLGVAARDLVRWIFDDLEPVREAVADLGGADAVQDAYVLARLTKGNAGRAREMLEKGVLDFETRTRTTRGMADILEDLGERNFDAFERYWIAEQVLTKSAQGIDTGFDKAAAQAIVDEGRKNPRYVKAARELWDFRSALLKYAADAGLMTSDELAHLRTKNPTPTPLYRHFEEHEFGGGRLKANNRGLAQTDAGVRRLKGSDRQVVPPLESLVGDAYRLTDAAHKHHAAQTLVKHALATEGGGNIVERLPEPPQEARRIALSRVQEQLIDAGWTPPAAGGPTLDELVAFYERRDIRSRELQDMVMPVTLDGERVWVQINDRDLWDALQGMTVRELEWFERVATFPTRMLRSGATQLNPDFFLVNPTRDAFQGAIYSRGPTRPPFWHLSVGLFHLALSNSKRLQGVLGPDTIAQRWAQEGGESAGIVGADRRLIREAYQKTVADLTRHGAKRLGHMALHPVRSAYAFFAALENATRLGEFAEVRKQQLRRGAGERQASTEAALAARDVTLDFLKAGTATRPVNRYVAFLTAQINDVEKMAREFNPTNLRTAEGRKRWATVTARATAMLTVPSIALYLLQMDDPIYQELPEYWKASSWIIVDNDAGPIPYTTESGKRIRVWAIPRPHLLGYVFGYMPEKMLEWYGEQDPEALAAMGEQAWAAFVPGFIPTLAVPLIENYANQSLHSGAPIVPRSAEDLPAGMQAQRRTGELARQLGDATNYAPAKIENTVRGYTGGLGMLGLDAADAALTAGKQATGLPILTPRQRPGADPLDTKALGLRRFVVPTPQGFGSESVRRLAEQYDEAEAHRQAWRGLLQRGEREQAAAYLAEHRDAILSVATGAETGGEPGPLRQAMNTIYGLQRRSNQVLDRVQDDSAAGARIDAAQRSQTDLARRFLAQELERQRRRAAGSPR